MAVFRYTGVWGEALYYADGSEAVEQDGLEWVPEGHLDAAQVVCEHLVFLRGGGIFLSSADALRLVGWLDKGLDPAAIVVALDRAAEARRKKRSRLPLTLGQASRYLKDAVSRVPAPRVRTDGPLQPLIALLEGQADDPSAARLATHLADLQRTASAGLRDQAMAAVRAFHVERWASAPPEALARARAEALHSMGDLANLVDEATLDKLVEEYARDVFRARYDWLTSAAVCDLLREEP